MQIFTTIKETQNYLKSSNKSIGFVPTMGALHSGHISLIQKAKKENDIAVCSIFVNPTQFDNKEDLKKYPRTLEADAKLLKKADCDIIFAPSAEEMYSSMPQLILNFGNLENVMEGKFRHGHFNGVGTVVAKLFNIIKPTKAYFGLKDLQQVAVLNRLVKDLSFDLELVPCQIIREDDGLAMSSRNRRLSLEARALAPNVYESLKIGKKLLKQGDSIASVKAKINTFFLDKPEFKMEYYEIVDFDNLENIDSYNSNIKTAICIAIYIDNVRLIDNLVF